MSQTSFSVVTFSSFDGVSEDDGRGEQNRASDEADDDDGDGRTGEPDRKCDDKAADTERVEQVSDAIGKQGVVSDASTPLPNWVGVAVRVVHGDSQRKRLQVGGGEPGEVLVEEIEDDDERDKRNAADDKLTTATSSDKAPRPPHGNCSEAPEQSLRDS